MIASRRSIPIHLDELIAAHRTGPDSLHHWVTAIIDGAYGDCPTDGDSDTWKAGNAIGRRSLGCLFRAQYKDHAHEWQDAGEYVASIGLKIVELKRVRVPESFCPGAIDKADQIKVPRDLWDSGARCFYPGRAGIPLMLSAQPTNNETRGT